MNLFGAKTFAHGIHPPESKDDTRGLAIHQFALRTIVDRAALPAHRQAGGADRRGGG